MTEWPYPSMRGWANTCQLPFDFEPQGDGTNDSYGSTRHNIVMISIRGAQYITASLHEVEEIVFDMSLRILSMRKPIKIQNDYCQVFIDLTSVRFNDIGVMPYLLVRNSRFSDFTQTPTYKELWGVQRNKLFLYANLIAQNTISTSTNKHIVLSYMEQAFSPMNDTALVGPANNSRCGKTPFLEATYPEQYKRPELTLDNLIGNAGFPYDPLPWNTVGNVDGVTPYDKGRIDGKDSMERFSDGFGSPTKTLGMCDPITGINSCRRALAAAASREGSALGASTSSTASTASKAGGGAATPAQTAVVTCVGSLQTGKPIA